MASWDRQPREPPKAYAYFTLYRDAGPGRSLAGIRQVSGVSVNRLEDLSAQYGWVERCDQWDAHLQAIHDRALITEAAKAGRRRAEAFGSLLDKSSEALKKIDLASANLGQVATAMKAACEGLRLEEGLATAHLTLEMHDARIVLSRLPAEFREGLRRVLATDPHAGTDPLGMATVRGRGAGDDGEDS